MTDYLKKQGSLAVASHMRRLSESISQDVAEIYKDHDLLFEPKWFPVFCLLAEQSPVTATEIADQLGVTHSAINQIAQELIDQGYIESQSDKQDKRRRLFVFSVKGKNLVSKLEPVWLKIKSAIEDLLQESGGQFLANLYLLEACHKKAPLAVRVKEMSHHLQDLQIVRYEASYKKYFADLNTEWLKKYCAIEKLDEQIFANPELILTGGGEIFFALSDKQVVGTAAVLYQEPNHYEFARFAVTAKYQGLGIGKKLLNACINEVKRRGGTLLTLETVSILKAASSLYREAGFVKYKPDHLSKYKRVDTYMRLKL